MNVDAFFVFVVLYAFSYRLLIDVVNQLKQVNTARVEEQQNRGYDTITTQKLSTNKPYVEAQPTPWQKANTMGDAIAVRKKSQ